MKKVSKPRKKKKKTIFYIYVKKHSAKKDVPTISQENGSYMKMFKQIEREKRKANARITTIKRKF